MLVAQGELTPRLQLLEKLIDARRRSDQLFDIVHPASLYARPIRERHRIIFYIGHLEAFDWNLLHQRAFELKSFNPDFDRLFAFGIDPVGGGLPSDRAEDWPAHEIVRDYVRRVRAALDDKLNEVGQETSPTKFEGNSIETLLNVAVEHRLMHVETLAYMLHQLPTDQKVHRDEPATTPTRAVDHRMVQIAAGDVTLGLARDSSSFGWDNEFASHTQSVSAFEIDKYMVTNRQFLEFVGAQGYENRAWWSNEDWEWKNAAGISHPAFWKRESDTWLYQTMFSEIPLPLDWPVYVSQAEAAAYARWAGKSLPTEAEWHHAAYGELEGQQRLYPWGDRLPEAVAGNFHFRRWSPSPVNAYPDTQSAFGVEGMLGNGWEWTSSVFAPFPGFEPFSFYRGYSADFFDGKHFVMKGGSARTAACMLRPTFRNWFQPHYQYVYAGFRCVKR